MTVYLNLVATALNIISTVFIIVAIINVRRTIKILQEWGDRLRAASADTHPQGQDRETGLGS